MRRTRNQQNGRERGDEEAQETMKEFRREVENGGVLSGRRKKKRGRESVGSVGAPTEAI